ncbi:MAG: hypothetical protein K2Y21_01190 [Phycisphaerales bacterium]|nr:hypothetical protein [Phycisphaerales bacterium]
MARKSRSNSDGLTTLSTAALQAEIRRRSKQSGALQRKYERLTNQLAELRKQIAAQGGAIPGGGRASNAVSLVDALAKVLDGKTLGVTEAADAVLASGYITTSPNFRTIVNQTFIKNRSRFKKVARGRYTAA